MAAIIALGCQISPMAAIGAKAANPPFPTRIEFQERRERWIAAAEHPIKHTMEAVAEYELVEAVPAIEDYLRLRRISGLTPRSIEAARAGLPGSFFAVCVRLKDETVAMGRIISDGSLFFHLVDVAVDPAHQGKGHGKAVVAALLAHVRRVAPAEAYVSLMANGEAHRLYGTFGFTPVMPDARGMALWTSFDRAGKPESPPGNLPGNERFARKPWRDSGLIVSKRAAFPKSVPD